MTPSPLERVSDAGSVSDARLTEIEKTFERIADNGLFVDDCRDAIAAFRELRQLRALAEERRLGPREG